MIDASPVMTPPPSMECSEVTMCNRSIALICLDSISQSDMSPCVMHGPWALGGGWLLRPSTYMTGHMEGLLTECGASATSMPCNALSCPRPKVLQPPPCHATHFHAPGPRCFSHLHAMQRITMPPAQGASATSMPCNALPCPRPKVLQSLPATLPQVKFLSLSSFESVYYVCLSSNE